MTWVFENFVDKNKWRSWSWWQNSVKSFGFSTSL